MKGMLAVILFIACTAFCWGIYGPVLHNGQHDLGAEIATGKHIPSSLRPFICVGLAYFIIAVLVPGIWLKLRGEAGQWTVTGLIWSLAAGAAGAFGALGIILAFKFHGSPIYVMPLVFGGAPVINTFVSMFMAKTTKEAGPIFFAGLILVITGAVIVLVFKPSQAAAGGSLELQLGDLLGVIGGIALTALSWGAYGPVLHKGQVAMKGSRLRPLICVGLSYFVLAVILPLVLSPIWSEPGAWTGSGIAWSLAAGAAGAIGALGIIMAFNSGGKPIYVMPLVFGFAPVVNTFTQLIKAGALHQGSPFFFAGLIIVITGAVTVLVFSPKGKPHAAPHPAPVPREPART